MQPKAKPRAVVKPRGSLAHVYAACFSVSHVACSRRSARPAACGLLLAGARPRGMLPHAHAACCWVPTRLAGTRPRAWLPGASVACKQIHARHAATDLRGLLLDARACGCQAHARLPSRCPRGLLLETHAAPCCIYIYISTRLATACPCGLQATCTCCQPSSARMAWNQMSTLPCHMPTRLTSRCPRRLLEHAHAKCTGGLHPDVHAACY